MRAARDHIGRLFAIQSGQWICDPGSAWTEEADKVLVAASAAASMAVAEAVDTEMVKAQEAYDAAVRERGAELERLGEPGGRPRWWPSS
jgi:hypothetical protein